MKQNASEDEPASFSALKDDTRFSDSPAREIRRNYLFVTGIIHTRCGSTVRFEGPLERNFYQCVDAFDFDVIEVRHQPVCISYVDSKGRSRRYYPDALVTYADSSKRAPTLYEIKETGDYQKNRSELDMKFAAGRAYCEKMGWEFQVATEKTIRTPRLENAVLLRAYRNRPYDEVLARRLVRVVEADPGLPAWKLANVEGNEPATVALCWGTLWALVARGVLHLDPERPITRNTAVRTPRR